MLDCHVGCHLQLAVFLHEAVVELGQLVLHVFLDVLLRVADNLKDLVPEFVLRLVDKLLQLVKHGVHQGRQVLDVSVRLILSFLNLLVHESELFAEVVE